MSKKSPHSASVLTGFHPHNAINRVTHANRHWHACKHYHRRTTMHAHLHTHLTSQDTREYFAVLFIYTSTHENIPLISMNTHTHTHTEPYTPDRLIVWGCMDAWIKLLVQESRASRLIKKRPCAAGLERKRARWRKRKHARAVWFCISLTKAGGREGWKSSISHAGLRGGSQCNHF